MSVLSIIAGPIPFDKRSPVFLTFERITENRIFFLACVLGNLAKDRVQALSTLPGPRKVLRKISKMPSKKQAPADFLNRTSKSGQYRGMYQANNYLFRKK